VFGFNPDSLSTILRANGLEPEILDVCSGRSLLPLRPSLRGAMEWLASQAIHRLARGSLGMYISCYARKTVSPS
jgi:hypothetical protein